MKAMKLAVMAGGAAVLCLVAGCSEPTTGQATPGPTSVETTSTTAPAPTTTSSAKTPPPASYTNNQLCLLLGDAEVAALGASSAPKPGNSFTTGYPQCTWSDEIGIVLTFGQGVTTANFPGTPLTVSGHPAVMKRSNPGVEICEIIVDASSSSSVSMSVSLREAGQGKYDICESVKKVADIVVPKVKG